MLGRLKHFRPDRDRWAKASVIVYLPRISAYDNFNKVTKQATETVTGMTKAKSRLSAKRAAPRKPDRTSARKSQPRKKAKAAKKKK